LALVRAAQAAAQRAELEQIRLAESNHRVRNSLQQVADLLALAPATGSREALDEAAGRVRSIAAVHDLVTRADGGSVPAGALLGRVAAGVDSRIELQVDDVALPLPLAQRLTIAANELLTNARKHGAPPI